MIPGILYILEKELIMTHQVNREKQIQLLKDIYTITSEGILFDTDLMPASNYSPLEMEFAENLLAQVNKYDSSWFKDLEIDVIEKILFNSDFYVNMAIIYFKPIDLVVAVDTENRLAHFYKLEDFENM